MGVRFFSTPHFRLYRRFPPSLPPSLLLAKEPAAGTGPEQKGGEGSKGKGKGSAARRVDDNFPFMLLILLQYSHSVCRTQYSTHVRLLPPLPLRACVAERP